MSFDWVMTVIISITQTISDDVYAGKTSSEDSDDFSDG